MGKQAAILIGSSGYGAFVGSAVRDLDLSLESVDGNTVEMKELQRHPALYVIIATPNYTHRNIVATCLRAGKHVLCEKPLALNLRDITDLYELAAAEGRYLGVGFVLPNHPFYSRLKESQAVRGPIRSVTIRNLATEHTLLPRWYWEKNRSGGWFLVSEIHWYHLFAWLVDAQALRVVAAAEQTSAAGRTVATECRATASGASLHVHHRLDATYATASTHVAVTFADGTRAVIVDWVPQEYHQTDDGGRLGWPEGVARRTVISLDSRGRDAIYRSLILTNVENLLTHRTNDRRLVTLAHRAAMAAQSLADCYTLKRKSTMSSGRMT